MESENMIKDMGEQRWECWVAYEGPNSLELKAFARQLRQ